MPARLVLLSALALAACLAGRLAAAQQEDAGTCGLWGIAAPGEEDQGVRLGARLGEMRRPAGSTSDGVRLYDRLEHQFVRYDGAPGGLTVQTIRCDEGEPVIVGRGIGGAKEQSISIGRWQARETRNLAGETRTLVGSVWRSNVLHLWSIKQITPVTDSRATDYVILERWCLADKPVAAGASWCALVGWSTVTVRSLVNPLPING